MSLLDLCTAIFLLGLASWHINADLVADKQALLSFVHNVRYSHPLDWNQNSNVCNWTGVTCSGDQTRVIALQLPGMGFQGSIPPNTLSRLSGIQILSLSSNSLSGSFPVDFSKLRNLTTLFLQSNNFSGPLPFDFSVWKNLAFLDLSNNIFNGTIPSSMSNLTHLTSLNLANNSLSGNIPDIDTPSLQEINFANNSLTGDVPYHLQRFPSWVFSGNNLSSVTAPPRMKHTKLGAHVILGIVIGGCVLCFSVIALVMLFRHSKKERGSGLPTKSLKNESSSNIKVLQHQDRDNRLVFFEGCSLAFDLEDLLRASAEILGKGTFGITYKAALEDSTTVVVKRLKEVSVAKRDFELQMELVGSIRHENVSPLRAYYYSKDEKLMVYDYHEEGSLYAMLHGERQKPLDWETRVRIAVGAARGIAHIHTHNGGKLAHGNIKASNIFLNSHGYGCISDAGLATLASPILVKVAAGYHDAELEDSRKPSQASDVYSFGVLLLELITGKCPVFATGQNDELVHLVRWVHSMVREEWTGEVFDMDLLRDHSIEEEMVDMLQIGMACAVINPEKRPKMLDVVRMVEDIRRSNTDNECSIPTTAVSTPKQQEAEAETSSALK